MNVQQIAIGSDHAGFELKETIKAYLATKGIMVKDFGPATDARADYPDYAHPVATFVENNENVFGILICGSGNGIT